MNKFILIHIGNKWFDYINDCIEQILLFNNDSIIYVGVNLINMEKVMIDKNVIIVVLDDIKKSFIHKLFSATTKLNCDFRDGFWKYALERFFYIENIMKKYNLKDIFHIENDNLIYCDMDEYIDLFKKEYKIAAVFDNDNRCIPSVVYIKNEKYLHELNKFIINNPDNNDMEIIAKFKKENSSIDNLPIMPNKFNNIQTTSGQISTHPEKYHNNIDKFNSIFDAAAIGQYLGGVDPRNINGNTVGFINETCLFNPTYFKFIWELDNKKRKIPYMIWNEQKIKINNLHIHCKDLKKFKSNE